MGPDQSPCTSTWLEVAIDVGGKKDVWRLENATIA